MKHETEEAHEVGFAVATGADGGERLGAGLPFMGYPSDGPSGVRSRVGRCPGLAGIEEIGSEMGIARRWRRLRSRRPFGLFRAGGGPK